MARTNKVLIALTSHDKFGDTGKETGYYVPEAAHPWQVFRRAGLQVDYVSVRGGTPPAYGFDADDPAQRLFVESETERLAVTPAAAEVAAADYDAIFYAGGHGTMWDFAVDKDLAVLGRDIYENGGVVAAVCHGPAALVPLTLSDGTLLVAGKDITGFTNSEEEAAGATEIVPFLLQTALEELGARYHVAPDFTENVVRDGRLVTGQNPASATGTAKGVLDALND
ncbi:type 1 glutamine amidotransferase domain-containing protein [Allokutzneria sp. A3M-2-11 16]|uniref:type 1 glutamine amidotransferase domain-containing protein n=1 Tax=Allokutzneria sp. A3M-2-11 16 TaxID=2962043 RepID=UPI0020B760D2|nr:type 1 glutamine amidotransferase domain-containing protein [Allokutzneria sp. A3M-2-11 16]MCP3799403.1 type 1 glutamine amidotransferase domain-containing protein [Allokutzneria sp. A3M-2-11 16]